MGGRRSPAPRSVRAAARLIALAVLAVGVLPIIGRGLGAHLAHIAIPAAAFILFAGYAIRDIRRNGRPRFSWRDRPQGPGRSPS